MSKLPASPASLPFNLIICVFFWTGSAAAAEPAKHTGEGNAVVSSSQPPHSPHQQKTASAPGASLSTPAAIPKKRSPYRSVGMPQGGRDFYQATAGIENMRVERTASGNLIRFSYVVTDPDKAKIVVDKQAEPHLIDPQANVMLDVPVMEKVGPLRQTTKLETGKHYWVVFSNKGDHVKSGDVVNVVIGNFHVEGLKVE